MTDSLLKRFISETIQYRSKKILLLVHPDIVFETNFKFAQQYYQAIEYNSGRFDYVISHLFYSDKADEYLKWDYNTSHLFHNFRKMIKEVSSFAERDKDYSISFDKALAGYLIDHPGSTIYFAGGYTDSCVKATQEALEGKMGWLVRETNTQVALYPELLISSRHNPTLG